jgi:hypothetical protein
MRILTILLILYSISVQASYRDENLCDQRSKYFLQDKQSIGQSLINSSVGTRDVILVAVEHHNYESKTYPLIVDALINTENAPDCFLLEMSPSEQEERLIKSLNRDPNQDWRVFKETFGDNWTEVFRYLHNKGIKIYPVDSDVDDDNDVLWLNKRDELMANKIKDLLKNNVCKRPILPIGAMHLLSGYKGRKNLVEQLSTNGVSTFRLGLSIAGVMESDDKKGFRIGSLWSLSRGIFKIEDMTRIKRESFYCDQLPSITDFAYSLPTISYDFPLLYDSTTKNLLGRVSDLEFWIYYPCTTHACLKMNNLLVNHMKKIGLTFY